MNRAFKATVVSSVGLSLAFKSTKAKANTFNVDEKRNEQPLTALQFSQVALPYPYNALEPNIDGMTMDIHYTKHHAKYVETLNQLIVDTPYDKMSLEEIIQTSVDKKEDKKI